MTGAHPPDLGGPDHGRLAPERPRRRRDVPAQAAARGHHPGRRLRHRQGAGEAPGQGAGEGRVRPRRRARRDREGAAEQLVRRLADPGEDRLLRGDALRALHRVRRVRAEPDQRLPRRDHRLPAQGLRRDPHPGHRRRHRRRRPAGGAELAGLAVLRPGAGHRGVHGGARARRDRRAGPARDRAERGQRRPLRRPGGGGRRRGGRRRRWRHRADAAALGERAEQGRGRGAAASAARPSRPGRPARCCRPRPTGSLRERQRAEEERRREEHERQQAERAEAQRQQAQRAEAERMAAERAAAERAAQQQRRAAGHGQRPRRATTSPAGATSRPRPTTRSADRRPAAARPRAAVRPAAAVRGAALRPAALPRAAVRRRSVRGAAAYGEQYGQPQPWSTGSTAATAAPDPQQAYDHPPVPTAEEPYRTDEPGTAQLPRISPDDAPPPDQDDRR